MPSISDLFASVPDMSVFPWLYNRLVSITQSELFFALGLEKERRRKAFVGKHFDTVFLGPSLRGLKIDGLETIQIDKAIDGEALKGAAVIFTNNDASNIGTPDFTELYQACPDTFFVGWDWDNHHWLAASAFLAAHSDLYVPVHPDNRGLLARFNSAITDPINTGSVQWPLDFLLAQDPKKLPRQRGPFGKHTAHPNFVYRNSVVQTLSATLPDVGFNDAKRGYHERPAQDRYDEWAGYKTHWIMPGMADIPTRLFDALVTGGIPIVPEALRFATSDLENIVYYGEADILAPSALIEMAEALFDSFIDERVSVAITYHHANTRLGLIMRRAYNFCENLSH